ncbi:uncharacterized protein LAESUDRAFT_811211 [Laetiporus sulphureus 93-53]|uniref:Uncharacterized protein n=1 Tax=Laetiporus sulphureus 93-53 TaxID=1314785 RepID=A0A165F8I4_9APHY|nr:uncharacterized protein LAESUDRAFT_811211 [Laetiporus sulphureus 93-53]KZT08594.1 hypothetical protein LAESUDRAFT_811211 [Laetiporus sulphureus 93-53]
MSGSSHRKAGYADAQDMFRVSPWISYDPSPDIRNDALARSNIHFYNMSEDVDMDAPQISTLPEEETPEPQPARTSKFRVKLLVNEGKRSGSLGSSSSRKPAQGASDEEDEEEDEEEDQLIDDDDDGEMKLPAAPIAAPSTSTSSSKRGSGRGRGGRRRGGKTEPAFSTISHELQGGPVDIPLSGASTPLAASSGRKKAGAGRGGTIQRAIRKKPSHSASKPPRTIPSIHRDEVESILSETYPGTAASSPLMRDDRTPESELPIPPAMPTMVLDDGALEGVPLPVYPLPSKPFPVQPPPKIGTGFAPVMPLDKSGKSVRRWRQVNREIRGIAGGRWFARTWAGEKESEYASAAATQAATHAAQVAADREAASAAAMVAAGITLPPKLAGASLGATSFGKSTKAKMTNSISSHTTKKRNNVQVANTSGEVPIVVSALP